MTPRKLQALMKVHFEVKKQESGQQSQNSDKVVTGFIDDIPGW